MEASTRNKIPVTIITGFLGAGKTTLLNNLIREYPDKQYAIIETELGEAGIDSDLVLRIGNTNICELSNGCICCTLNDDLAGLLKDLLRSGKLFNHLLVETTGMADPSSVVQTFFSDREVRSAFIMDSVICLSDALYFLSTLREQEVIPRQVAIADLVLLNKAGDQQPAVLDRIRKEIRRMNPHCMIMETSYADIRGHRLLNRFEYGTGRVQAFTLDVFGQDTAWEAAGYYAAGSTHRSAAPGGKGGHDISSHSFRFTGEFDLEKFSCWMEYFLYINQSTVFRVKGILNFSGNPQKMILQSVRSSYTLEDGDYWETGEERENRLVFIGEKLPYEETREALESLLA
jgi:G3E family GTPase